MLDGDKDKLETLDNEAFRAEALKELKKRKAQLKSALDTLSRPLPDADDSQLSERTRLAAMCKIRQANIAKLKEDVAKLRKKLQGDPEAAQSTRESPSISEFLLSKTPVDNTDFTLLEKLPQVADAIGLRRLVNDTREDLQRFRENWISKIEKVDALIDVKENNKKRREALALEAKQLPALKAVITKARGPLVSQTFEYFQSK